MEEKSPDELRKRMERVSSALSGYRDFTLEVFKARQAFYERLILLNAGTLTLLVTVAGALASASHTNGFHLAGGHRLVTGCWMLIASTVLALLHNWVNITTLIHSFFGQLSGSLQIDMDLLQQEASSFSGKAIDLGTIPQLDAQTSQSHKKAIISENICRVLGPAAQILTIWAYVEFVLSLRSTINLMVN